MEIKPEFHCLIGQDRAKNTLSLSAIGGENGKEMLSVLITGEKGLGKTRVMDCYGNALVNSNPARTRMSIQPRDIRLLGDNYNNLVSMLISGEEYILEIDEAHELVTDGTKQCTTLFNFLRRALDGNNKGKMIPYADDQFTMFDRKKHVISLATNYPHVLDKSGALQSRFTSIVLDLYNEDELYQITGLMAQSNGLVFADGEGEDPMRRIARCGRGTARFLERIFEQLALIPTDTIAETHVAAVLRNLKLFPRGLGEGEVNIIKKAQNGALTRTQCQLTGKLEGGELNKSLAYMTDTELRFLNQLPNGSFEITSRGRSYLKKCKEMGFEI